MAKKASEPKNVLERTYNVPLRREFLKVPRYERARKAMDALRAFIKRHMKSEDIKIGKYANEMIWNHGIKNPPHHVKVNAVKDDKGTVKVELAELPSYAKRQQKKQEESAKKAEELKKKTKKEEAKKEEAKTAAEKKEEAIEAIVEKAHEEKAEEAKEVLKEEIKELKEHPKKIHQPKPAPQPKSVQQHPTAPRSV